ncbi:MAG: hypothetical protein Ct9H90mP13_03720 [Pseudomonadota bacterium]|nr:MAG: hypothetical protein Ct9H90mP13_03720 [Pseudomonadota bacterium]
MPSTADFWQATEQEELARYIGADWLIYQDLDDLFQRFSLMNQMQRLLIPLVSLESMSLEMYTKLSGFH